MPRSSWCIWHVTIHKIRRSPWGAPLSPLKPGWHHRRPTLMNGTGIWTQPTANERMEMLEAFTSDDNRVAMAHLPPPPPAAAGLPPAACRSSSPTAVAYLALSHQGPQLPVLHSAAPSPISRYLYMCGLRKACKPAPQPVYRRGSPRLAESWIRVSEAEVDQVLQHTRKQEHVRPGNVCEH